MKQGMKYDTRYYQLREMVLNRMLEIIKNQIDVQAGGTVFFGDSLTELCDLDRFYPEIVNKYNTGICGITSGMLLNFIDEGVIKYKPAKIVIMVGTNDLGDTVQMSPRDIALNIKDMVEIIHNNLNDCEIYVCSGIPCIEEYHGYKAIRKGIRSNDMIKILFNELKSIITYDYCNFIDTYSPLCHNGEPIEEVYIDGLHVNDQGYVLLTNAIKEVICKENK